MSSLFTSASKIAFVFLIAIAISGCQSFRVKSRPPGKSSTQPSVESKKQDPRQEQDQSEDVGSSDVSAPVVEEAPSAPKFGLILGPGGAKTFAHIGFLHEVVKSKMPVVAVAGVEWGSLPAALFAQRESANDVEWQMMKIKPEDVVKRNLLTRSQEPVSLNAIQPFLSETFANADLKGYRLSFACPTLNLKTERVQVLSSGSAGSALARCLPAYPVMQPTGDFVAAPLDIKRLADHLRAKGATYIIFVDVLGGANAKKVARNNTLEAVYWHQVSEFYTRGGSGVDLTISIPMNEYEILDFDKKREIAKEGGERSFRTLKKILERWSL